MHNFSPFPVKIYTYIRFWWWQGGSAPLPNACFRLTCRSPLCRYAAWVIACRFRVAALSGNATLAFHRVAIAPKLNRIQLSAICRGGQSGKVIDLLAWRCLPLGHPSAASDACAVELISSSKRQCGKRQVSLKPAYGNFVFGGLHLHNFRPFFSLTFYKDIGFFRGWRILQPLHSKYWGAQPPRFLSLCNFIMLVWVQGSVFQISAAGLHPVQEIWGSHDSLYRDQIQKLLRCCREPYQHTDSSCYNDSEKSIVWPYYEHDDVPFRSYWRKGQKLNFWLYRGQTGKNDPILLATVSKCLSG